METSHMLRTLIIDPQRYYSASLRRYATAGKHVAHLPLTRDMATVITHTSRDAHARRCAVMMQQPVLFSPKFGAKSSHIFT
jgi:hypothetical protein